MHDQELQKLVEFCDNNPEILSRLKGAVINEEFCYSICQDCCRCIKHKPVATYGKWKRH